MSIILSTLAVTALLAWQDRPLPSLPLASPEARTAAEEATNGGDLDTRRSAADKLLDMLVQRGEPEATADFMLECEGARLLPVSMAVYWRELRRRWPLAEQRVRSLLAEPEWEPQGLLNGAILAAGHLDLTTPSDIECLSGYLNLKETAGDARSVLRRLTGFEFRSEAEFKAWWVQNRDRAPAEWWRRALDERDRRIVARWKHSLEADPQLASEALGSPLAAVRRLALEVFSRSDIAPSEAERGSDSPMAVALRSALEVEPVLELRVTILGLIPRFFDASSALELLAQALRSPLEQEEVAAVGALKLVALPKEAGRLLLSKLEEVYSSAESAGSPALRLELLSGVEQFDEELDATAVNSTLQSALIQERHPEVVLRVYAAVGRLADASFIEQLLSVLNNGATIKAKLAALDAATAIAQRHGQSDRLLPDLHGLLASEEVDLRYRAIQGLAALKSPTSAEPLAGRLVGKEPDWLYAEILEALSVIRNGDILPALLEFVPPEDQVDVYVKALRFQAGPSIERLQSAIATLQGRGQWEAAVQLLAPIKADAVEDENLRPQVERLKLLARTHWLLQAEELGDQRPLAEQTATQMGALQTSKPEDRELTYALAKLRLALDDIEGALDLFDVLLSQTAEGRRNAWSLALEAGEIAAAAGKPERARKLLEAARLQGGDQPKDADQVERLAKLEARLTEAESQETTPKPEEASSTGEQAGEEQGPEEKAAKEVPTPPDGGALPPPAETGGTPPQTGGMPPEPAKKELGQGDPTKGSKGALFRS